MGTRGGRKGQGVIGAHEPVAIVVATSPAMMGRPQRVMATRWKGRATRRKAEKQWFTGELIGSSRKAEEKYGGGRVTGVASSAWLLPTALSGHRRRESQRRWHGSRRRSVVGGESPVLAI
jgi:hypothetical protein